MQAKAIVAFNSLTRRFKPGDVVTLEEVGEAKFYACTDAKPPKAPPAPAAE